MNASAHAAPQPTLTPAQRDAFVADGFLIMRALGGAEQLSAMRTVALGDDNAPMPGTRSARLEPIRVREPGDA